MKDSTKREFEDKFTVGSRLNDEVFGEGLLTWIDSHFIEREEVVKQNKFQWQDGFNYADKEWRERIEREIDKLPPAGKAFRTETLSNDFINGYKEALSTLKSALLNTGEEK